MRLNTFERQVRAFIIRTLLALLGDGTLDTHSPARGAPIQFEARNGHVFGEGIVHFPVPARSIWDDIGFT